MMNGGPFVQYALSQIRQQEIERKARLAWRDEKTSEERPRLRYRGRAVRLDTVVGGC
jgi:hypothetical protein